MQRKRVTTSKEGGGFWREKERAEWSHIKSKESNLVRGREEFVKTKVSVTKSLGKGPPIVGNPKPTIQIGCEPKYRPSPLAIFWVAIFWGRTIIILLSLTNQICLQL